MARHNYNQAKRQREASKEKKKADKLQRKLDRRGPPPEGPATDEPGAEDSPPRS